MTGKAPVSCDCDVGCTTSKDSHSCCLLYMLATPPSEADQYGCNTWIAHLCSYLLASQNKRYAYLAEITFAVKSNATPSTLFLSILSHIAVLAVPGCAAKASMRLLCSQICAVLSLHSTVTTHCISVRDDCVQQTDSRCWKLQHCCLMTQTTSQILNKP